MLSTLRDWLAQRYANKYKSVTYDPYSTQTKLNKMKYIILLICFLVLSCQDADEVCPEPNPELLNQAISNIDSSEIGNYFEKKLCAQIQKEIVDEYENKDSLDAFIHDFLQNNIIKTKLYYLDRYFDLKRSIDSIQNNNVYRIPKYSTIQDSIIVEFNSTMSDKVDSAKKFEIPNIIPFEWYGHKIQYIRLSKVEQDIIEKQLIICKEWNKKCFDEKKYEVLSKFININMVHWGNGVHSLSFPLLLKIVIPYFPTQSARIHLKDHIGSWSSLEFISIGSHFKIDKYYEGPIE